jgi:hypothetical protein
MALAAVAASCGQPYEGVLEGTPKIELSTTTVEFGVVPCGAAAPAVQALTIRNIGTAPLTWSAQLSDTTQFSISGASGGTVAPGGEALLTIASRPVVPESVAALTLSAVLSITSNDPETPTIEGLTQLTTGGGMLEMVPQSISFGQTPVGVAAFETPTLLRNTGNQPIEIRIDPPTNPDFSLASELGAAPITVRLEPEQAVLGLVGRFTPSAIGPATASAAITVTGPVCGAPPSSIELAGSGSASGVGLQPGLLDFGLVPCGSAAASKVITLFSAASGPEYKFEVKLGKGAASAFTVSPESGTVPVGGSRVITVTPRAIPRAGIGDNLYGDVLTITTDAPGDAPHEVPLRMSPLGAVFSSSTSFIDFGNVKTSGSGEDRSFKVYNTGNSAGVIQFSVASNTFSVKAPSTITVAPSGTGTITVRAKPQGTGNKSGDVVPSTPSAICAPLPPAIRVTCKGT